MRSYLKKLIVHCKCGCGGVSNYGDWIRGHWNKGKTHIVSKETRIKISKIHKGKTVSKDTREKLRLFNLGKKHSEETKKKMRGKIPWNKDKTGVYSKEILDKISTTLRNNPYEMERIRNLGRARKGVVLTEEHKLKIKLNHANTYGKNNAMFGKKHSEETKKKMSLSRIGIGNGMYGKKHSKETLRKIGLSSKERVGLKNGNWQGGISFESYGLDWTKTLKESIRQRDDYTCRLCGIKQDKCKRKLDVHHINYDKENNNPINLITLCHICHTKTNGSRVKWTKFFNKLVRVNLKIIKGVILNG